MIVWTLFINWLMTRDKSFNLNKMSFTTNLDIYRMDYIQQLTHSRIVCISNVSTINNILDHLEQSRALIYRFIFLLYFLFHCLKWDYSFCIKYRRKAHLDTELFWNIIKKRECLFKEKVFNGTSKCSHLIQLFRYWNS